MRFADIPGNEELKKTLVSMADSGRIPHALMLYENEGCGALALALAYVQYINCTGRKDGDSCGECPSCRVMSRLVHPDTYFIFPVNASRKTDVRKPLSESFLDIWRELVLSNPYFIESDLYNALGIEGKSGVIAIAEAKYILEKLSLSPVGDGYKSVLLWLPEKMNQETANKLLKVVEEPPDKTQFFFITHNPDRVLQTVFSRCQNYRVMPLTKEERAKTASVSPEEREEYAEFMAVFRKLMEGVMARDLQTVLDSADMMSALDSKEKQKGFCIFAAEAVRKIFLCRHGLSETADIPDSEKPFYDEVSKKAGKAFCARIIPVIDRSAMLLDRNVNQKMVFCDLAGQMFLNF